MKYKSFQVTRVMGIKKQLHIIFLGLVMNKRFIDDSNEK